MGGFSLVVSLTIFKVGYGICLSDVEEGSGWGRGGEGRGGGGGAGGVGDDFKNNLLNICCHSEFVKRITDADIYILSLSLSFPIPKGRSTHY
jgi:hypothetical protein